MDSVLSRIVEVLTSEVAKIQAQGISAFQSGDALLAQELSRKLSDIQKVILSLKEADASLSEWNIKLPIVSQVTSKAQEIPKPVEPEVVDRPKVVSRVVKVPEPVVAPVEVRAEPVMIEPVVDPTEKRREAERRQFIEQTRRVSEQVRDFDLSGDMSEPALFEIKGLICRLRGLYEQSKAMAPETSEIIAGDLDFMSDAFNRTSERPDFFGLNQNRHQDALTWFELADAYSYLPAAYNACEFLTDLGEALSPSDRSGLLHAASAGETYLYRYGHEHALFIADEAQTKLNDRLRALANDYNDFVPFWTIVGSNAKKLHEIKREADKLSKLLEAIESKTRKKLATELAMKNVHQVLTEDENVDFADELRAAVTDAMDAGVRPSTKEFVHLLAPYKSVLEEPSDPRLEPIVKEISKFFLHSQAKGMSVDAFATHEVKDEVEDEKLQSIRELVRGKTFMFVGGNKGQSKRRLDYVKKLELSELIWPDSEDDSRLSVFEPGLKKADVVFFLIRWSRHSYKGVIDEAKRMGKKTIILKAGLGLNRIIDALEKSYRPEPRELDEAA